MVRRRVVVTGRVQGVFFRDSTRAQAERHGLAGWVRNLPDGAVEAELEGAEPDVEAVVAWMRHGPEHARVEQADVGDVSEQGETGFTVR